MEVGRKWLIPLKRPMTECTGVYCLFSTCLRTMLFFCRDTYLFYLITNIAPTQNRPGLWRFGFRCPSARIH